MKFTGFSLKSGAEYCLQILQRRRPVHFLWVTTLLAVWFSSVSNLSFWRHVRAIIAQSSDLPLLFSLSVPMALFLLMNAALLLTCSWRWLIKPFGALLLLTCAAATYATVSYGIILDGNMLINFLETNAAEAASYISTSSLTAVLLLGVLPALLLLRIKIYYPSFLRAQLQRFAALTAVLGLAAICIFPFYQQYSFIGRNNPVMNKEILPASYVYSAAKYALSSWSRDDSYTALGEGATRQLQAKPRLMLLILGETARADNFSALGYPRPTNQYSDKENVISFAEVRSCGTATAYSVPCMFSNLPRAEFSPRKAKNREGVLDVIQKAGYDVLWLDNDAGCKGVCKRVTNLLISPDDSTFCDGSTCRDGIFVNYARKLTENISRDTVLAFHFIGSHGPRYYERYPEEFRVFTPDCSRPDVEKCSREEIINAYDNSILYTDRVIYDLINVLEERMDQFDPMLLYISDHGESLGENGIYLHAAPRSVAPEEQTHVPLQLWLPQSTASVLNIDKQCLAGKARSGSFSHDNFFHSLLGILQIKAAEYNQSLDIFNSCSS